MLNLIARFMVSRPLTALVLSGVSSLSFAYGLALVGFRLLVLVPMFVGMLANVAIGFCMLARD